MQKGRSDTRHDPFPCKNTRLNEDMGGVLCSPFHGDELRSAAMKAHMDRLSSRLGNGNEAIHRTRDRADSRLSDLLESALANTGSKSVN